MKHSHNGQDQTSRDHGRRLRFDDLEPVVLRGNPGATGTTTAEFVPGNHSGRRLVLAAGAVVLLVWGTLYLVFRDWRASYRERAQYGETHVVPAIEPLRGVIPPGISVGAWHNAVDETRAMLLTVTGSNLLDVKAMDALRAELAEHVRRAGGHPATAVAELAEIWNDVADRGEFLFRDSRSPSGGRHPRPNVIPSYGATRVVPAIDPLSTFVPPGIKPDAWLNAIDQTRAMLISVTDSSALTVKSMHKLHDTISRHVNGARNHPATALTELAEIWNLVAPERENRHPRPQILPPRAREPQK